MPRSSVRLNAGRADYDRRLLLDGPLTRSAGQLVTGSEAVFARLVLWRRVSTDGIEAADVAEC